MRKRVKRSLEILDIQALVAVTSKLEVAVDRIERAVAKLDPLIEQAINPVPNHASIREEK